jgi:hypothetical protein
VTCFLRPFLRLLSFLLVLGWAGTSLYTSVGHDEIWKESRKADSMSISLLTADNAYPPRMTHKSVLDSKICEDVKFNQARDSHFNSKNLLVARPSSVSIRELVMKRLSTRACYRLRVCAGMNALCIIREFLATPQITSLNFVSRPVLGHIKVICPQPRGDSLAVLRYLTRFLTGRTAEHRLRNLSCASRFDCFGTPIDFNDCTEVVYSNFV